MKSPFFDLADKYNIKIQESREIDSFFGLWKETFKRAGKKPPLTLSYVSRIYDTLAPRNMAKIYYAARDDQVLAGNLMLYWRDTAYFLFGGSISGEKYGAPHLLHWTLIQNAARDGYAYYHMGGSWKHYENKNTAERIKGVDEFKRRFGISPTTSCWGKKILIQSRPGFLRKLYGGSIFV